MTLPLSVFPNLCSTHRVSQKIVFRNIAQFSIRAVKILVFWDAEHIYTIGRCLAQCVYTCVNPIYSPLIPLNNGHLIKGFDCIQEGPNTFGPRVPQFWQKNFWFFSTWKYWVLALRNIFWSLGCIKNAKNVNSFVYGQRCFVPKNHKNWPYRFGDIATIPSKTWFFTIFTFLAFLTHQNDQKMFQKCSAPSWIQSFAVFLKTNFWDTL